jgi:hypothetical protein
MSFLDTLKGLLGFGSKTPTLQPGDRMLNCEDCGNPFVFDVGEQRFFKEKGFTDPKRCTRCRKKVRSRMRRRGRGHQAHQNQNQNQHNSHGNQNQHRGGRFSRRRSVIEGDSPYVDER